MAAPAQTPTTFLRCRLCQVLLKGGGDDAERGFCKTHIDDPRAIAMLAKPSRQATPGEPPPFTPAERSLIRHTGVHLPAADLLKILNDRLVADRGLSVVRHTLEQLHAEVAAATATAADTGWGGLRRRLARARKDGVLEQLTPQVIDDFAVVFQLTAAQVTYLRDAVASAKDA